jgi:RNA polymerase sigma factor (TIGR02999 family)
MSADEKSAITEQLRAGDPPAMANAFAALYPTLRRLAERALAGERAGHTLGSAGLISEAYFRLVEQRAIAWQNREHFVATAAQMMRRILVDYARGRAAQKRGAGARPLTLDENAPVAAESLGEIAALHDALEILATIDPQQSEIVALRFFGGLDHAEIARHLGLSVPTVERRWRLARAWLYRQLST